ncbi:MULTISPECIES: GNAT family N-acetyltransferase [Methylosinus]|uniref:N-acetyltransferase n=1 Tax=Methylosinus trichosporium (strain ATCC 35070 / NCIMB 11131 / UNIQEM 75 / OB3b) TaxID=595536 RepID=A0A2D2CY58_METT3|nr:MULTISPECIES: GNAT family protein [Methylosinus]ATQ67646.1 N-acetyltransferase [Methylosinus trichosporium OB3b]
MSQLAPPAASAPPAVFHAPLHAPLRAPERVRLEGERVALVPLAAAHADELHAATHGAEREEVWRYMFSGPFVDAQAFRADIEEKARSEEPLFFAVIDKKNGRAVGFQAYLNIEPAHRAVEVGWVLYSPALQRTAAASEAQYLFAAHAFETLGCRRYVWKCDDANEKSKAAAIRLGFVPEGLFRQHMIVKGRNRDTAWFSMLDGEWPARRSAFEAFLAKENFDAQGRQKTSLSALNGRISAANRG